MCLLFFLLFEWNFWRILVQSYNPHIYMADCMTEQTSFRSDFVCHPITHEYKTTEAGYWKLRAGYFRLKAGYCLFLKSLVNFHRVKLNYLSTSFTSYWKPCHSLLFLPKRLDSQEESWHKTFMWLFSGGAKLVINFLLCKFLQKPTRQQHHGVISERL